MRKCLRVLIGLAGAVATLLVIGSLSERSVAGQGVAANFPRTAEGKPNFSGIWQALNTANWDLQDHAARQGPVIALGAAYSVPAGQGVVEGNDIPYLPTALAKKKENMENALKLDPEIKCFMPGVPRAMYMPYPFQIADADAHHDGLNKSALRISMNSDLKSPSDTWMGWSTGWEGHAGHGTDSMIRCSIERQLPQRRSGHGAHTPIRTTPSATRPRSRTRRFFQGPEDQHATLSATRQECATLGIQVRRVRGRSDVRPSPQAGAQVGSKSRISRASHTVRSRRGALRLLPAS